MEERARGAGGAILDTRMRRGGEDAAAPDGTAVSSRRRRRQVWTRAVARVPSSDVFLEQASARVLRCDFDDTIMACGVRLAAAALCC